MARVKPFTYEEEQREALSMLLTQQLFVKFAQRRLWEEELKLKDIWVSKGIADFIMNLPKRFVVNHDGHIFTVKLDLENGGVPDIEEGEFEIVEM